MKQGDCRSIESYGFVAQLKAMRQGYVVQLKTTIKQGSAVQFKIAMKQVCCGVQNSNCEISFVRM